MKNNLLQKKIPNGWSLKQLKELGEFKTSSVDKKIKSGEKKVNLVNYMDVYKNKIIDRSIDFMSVSAKESQLISSQIEKGDILFTPSSETPDDIGHSAVVTEDLPNTLYSYHLMRFRLSDKFQNKIDLDFRAFLFNSRYVLKQFENLSTGITRYTLTKEKFESVDVFFPENINEQKKIAEILSSVDEEIKRVEDLISKTENLKKGLMTELFTKGIGHEKFKKTKIGTIPDNWDLVKGEDISSVITKGASPGWQGFSYQSDGMLFVTSENVRNGVLDIKNPKFLPLEFHNKLKNSQLKNGDILINIVGASIGRSCLYKSHHLEANINQAICLLRTNETILSPFVSQFLQHNTTIKRLISSQNGSARQNLSLADIRDFLFVRPSLFEQEKILTILSTVDKKIELNQNLKEKLNQLKKGLMLDLLSGKVRVDKYGTPM